MRLPFFRFFRFLGVFFPNDLRRFLFVLSVIGIIASKTVHIQASLMQQPVDLVFLIFFPTFWTKDIIVLILIHFALFRVPFLSRQWIQNNRVLATVLSLFIFLYRILFAFVMPFAIMLASCLEISYFVETEQIVQWSFVSQLIKEIHTCMNIFQESGGSTTYGKAALIQLFLSRVEPYVTSFVFRVLCCKRNKIPAWASGSGGGNNSNEEVSAPCKVKIDHQDYVTDSDSEEEKNMIRYKVYQEYNPALLRGSTGSRGWKILAAFMVLLCVSSLFRPVLNYNMIVDSVPFVLLDTILSNPTAKLTYQPSGNATALHFPYSNQVALGQPDLMKATEFVTEWLPTPHPLGFDRFTKERVGAWRKWAQLSAQSSPLDPPEGYHHAFDPLKISNLHNAIHPELTMANPLPNNVGKTKPIKDIKIRNVIILNMESTRADVFPIREDSDIVRATNKFRKTIGKKYDDMTKLTPFSAHIAGTNPREGGAGGIVVEGANSVSTFSSKSILATQCGVFPMVKNMFEEAKGEIYQPCLAHVFKAMNMALAQKCTASDDWRFNEWMTHFIQTTTMSWDRYGSQMNQMGFIGSESLCKEDIEKKNATFPLPPGDQNINYMGLREEVLKPYIRDVVQRSKKEKKRLFLSHMTVSTHHKYNMPPKEFGWDPLIIADDEIYNNYLNLVGFVERWLAWVVDMLKEEGVYNETLVVFVGDHGLSPGQESIGPNSRWVLDRNTYVNCYRIPLVFHHPHLPTLHLPVNATNVNLLPTILDMLLSSNSLPDADDPACGGNVIKLLKSLLPAYEGQSLLRPLLYRNSLGLHDYHFHLSNPGGSFVTASSHDPKHPFRVAVPQMGKDQFMAANGFDDPNEENPVRTWTAIEMYEKVQDRWGKEAKEWAEKAVLIAGWWVEESKRRYRYKEEKPTLENVRNRNITNLFRKFKFASHF